MTKLLLLLSLLGLSACVVNVDCNVDSGRPQRDWSPTKSEIHAAMSLDYDSDRASLLRGIAVRPTLTAGEQVYLVDTALDDLWFESNRLAVVCDLINNPAFCWQAQERIHQRIRCLAYESDRFMILNSLAHRSPPVAAPTTLPA